jgi:16S rRNA (adenine1518-N6/adenine1519-N6)-dimethyltransferase
MSNTDIHHLNKPANKQVVAKKSFGQNFLHNKTLCHKIFTSSSITKNNLAIEVGPGTAALTTWLLNGCDNVILIEKDRECVEYLQNLLLSNYENINFASLKSLQELDGLKFDKGKTKNILLLNYDALKIDLQNIVDNFNKVFNTNFKTLSIIGNLPYNVGTLLVYNWCQKGRELIDGITIMLQKEVVQRMIAQHTSQHYGKLSVITQACFKAEYLFDVAAGNFNPPPSVTSAVIKLTRQDIECNIAKLSTFCETLFKQRRKKISNLIKNTKYTELFMQEQNKKYLDKRSDEITTQTIIDLACNL